MGALTAILTVTSVPLPPPLSAITLAPVAIFVTSIYLGPRIGFVTASLGSAVGFAIAVFVGTISLAGLPSIVYPVFLLGIIIARGPEGLILGVLRDRNIPLLHTAHLKLPGLRGVGGEWVNEIVAMELGTIYETLVFFSIDYFLTYPILLTLPREFAYLDFGTLIDLVFIVPAGIVLRVIRGSSGRRYYDKAFS